MCAGILQRLLAGFDLLVCLLDRRLRRGQFFAFLCKCVRFLQPSFGFPGARLQQL